MLPVLSVVYGIWSNAVRVSALLENIQFEAVTSPSVKNRILDVIPKFWDVYFPDGLKNPMLGYGFTIDTGAHTPYCCRKPSYGSNEGEIIMSHVRKLKDMG